MSSSPSPHLPRSVPARVRQQLPAPPSLRHAAGHAASQPMTRSAAPPAKPQAAVVGHKRLRPSTPSSNSHRGNYLPPPSASVEAAGMTSFSTGFPHVPFTMH